MRRFSPILIIILLFLSCNRATVRMDNYEVHGIDVSHYQSNINWEKIVAQDVHFAFAKASEGMTLVDSMFCKNWESMEDVGIIRGAYHFFRPNVPADLQAENFMHQFELENGDLPPVLDAEVLDGVSSKQLITGMTNWLKIVENQWNIKPIIYTNQNFYNDYLAGYFDDYPIWIARYSSFFSPNLIENNDWKFWQYGNRGRLDGIRGNVDFNVFHGNIFELQEMCVGQSYAAEQMYSMN